MVFDSINDKPALFPSMEDYLAYLCLGNRGSTAGTVRKALVQLDGWLRAEHCDPLYVSHAQLESFQSWLLVQYRSPKGQSLARSTVSARISAIKGWYTWLEERNAIITNPSSKLSVKCTRSRVVVKEYLSLKEAMALVQTQAEAIEAAPYKIRLWHGAVRNLALVATALATGRRISGLAHITLGNLDLERGEIRVEKEKGKMGRVLPVAPWAVDALRTYLTESRAWFLQNATDADENPYVFVTCRNNGAIGYDALKHILAGLVRETIRENPDLEELPQKKITWHSLRVTFATLLFNNGCNIRSVNELMLHRKLSTTARYTPIAVEDLRSVFLTTHPRS